MAFTSSLQAFVMPLTTEQRVVASSVIAVIKVKSIHHNQVPESERFVEAEVVHGLLGAQKGEKIKIFDDIRVNKDGKEYAICGRDPYFRTGKTYFIYLHKNPQGRLVTVQSSLDCLDVSGEQVEKEGAEGFELLNDKIARTQVLLSKQKDEADHADAGDDDKPAN